MPSKTSQIAITKLKMTAAIRVLKRVPMIFLKTKYRLLKNWMLLKLFFVLCVVFYHFYCKILMSEFKMDRYRFTSFHLRLWNEVATILLFAIVFLVVLKNTIDWLWALLALVIFSVTIMFAVKFYKKRRDKLS